MSNPAIPDIITVVGSAYLQPIADLLDKLLKRPISGIGPAGVSEHENGYSAALVILLVAVLESYTARLRFVRRAEQIAGSLSTPELLDKYFTLLPTRDELVEVFLIRNVLAHNHIWHLDVSDFAEAGAPTLATPKELGFQTNKHYEQVVDVAARKTRRLGLNVSPTWVDRSDVRKVFEIVWRTLKFMNAQDFRHTPLGVYNVGFRGKRRKFTDLVNEITDEGCGHAP
ncbi:hypothetical protein GCM10027082_46970 [Comamonas humi]